MALGHLADDVQGGQVEAQYGDVQLRPSHNHKLGEVSIFDDVRLARRSIAARWSTCVPPSSSAGPWSWGGAISQFVGGIISIGDSLSAFSRGMQGVPGPHIYCPSVSILQSDVY